MSQISCRLAVRLSHNLEAATATELWPADLDLDCALADGNLDNVDNAGDDKIAAVDSCDLVRETVSLTVGNVNTREGELALLSGDLAHKYRDKLSTKQGIFKH